MTDDERSGSCPTCMLRDPHEPLICRVCRSKLRSWLGDIPDLFTELQERTDELAEPLEHRRYVATVVEKVEQPDGKKVKVTSRVLTMRAKDQVAYLMPAGGSSSPSRTGPVSGSKEPRLPINEDQVDLTGHARPIATRAALDEDATGYTSVASTLDFWVEDWRSDRQAGEGRPIPMVPDLARWLLDRLDDAMDHSAPIDEFFEDVRRIHGALSAQLGLIDIPDYKRGIPCPRCSSLALVHLNGSAFIECKACPAVLSFTEFDEHVRSSWADHMARRKATMVKAKALRALVTALRSAGWRHDVRRESDVDWTTRVVHRWKRGTEAVELWLFAVDGELLLDALWYVADETDPRVNVSVGTGWVERHGATGLQKLARAAGLLATPAVAALAAQMKREKAA